MDLDSETSRPQWRLAFAVALVYFALGATWIVVSDELVNLITTDPDNRVILQTFKGLSFIFMTAVFLYLYSTWLVQRGEEPAWARAARLRGTEHAVRGNLFATCVLFIFVILVVSVALRHSYLNALEHGERDVRNLSLAIEAQTSQAVRSIDVTLENLLQDHEVTDLTSASPRMRALLQDHGKILHEAQSILLVNANGDIAATSDAAERRYPSVADRDYFLAPKQNPANILFIGQVLRSRVDGKLFFGVSRRLPDVGGRFSGVIAARVDPTYFASLYDRIAVGEQGVISLYRADGVLLARGGKSDDVNAVHGSLDAQVASHLKTAPSGSFFTVSDEHQPSSLVNYLTLPDAPIVVAVSFQRNDMLAAWRAEARNVIALSIAFLCLSLTLSYLMRREELRQRRLITRLRASENRFRAFMRFNPALAWIVEPDGSIVYASEALCKLLGETEDDLIGQPLERWIPGALRGDARALPANEESLESYTRADASRGELLLHRFRLGDSNISDLVAGIAIDITEQRRAEQILRLYGRVLESTPHGVVIVDTSLMDQPIIYVNPSFERITGYSAAETLGKNCRLLQGPDRDQAGILELRAALREEREATVVLRNYRSDGTLFWNELTVAPVRDNDQHVSHFVGLIVDVTEQRRYEEAMLFNASHDPLTKLPNRVLLEDRLAQAMRGAQHAHTKVALMLINLDHFQVFNDSLDRAGGDLVLHEVADRLIACISEHDSVARLGGDEFAVVCGECVDSKTVALIAERIIEEIRMPLLVRGQVLSVTCSMGVVLYPDDGPSLQVLLRNVQYAMHFAKEAGRDNYKFFRSEMDLRAAERLALENRLRDALDNEEFVLHYQPQVQSGTGLIIGMEALVRWNDPERGLVFPGQFISVAEQCGLIVPLGKWVMLAACEQNMRWQDAGLEPFPVAVNVSIAQFRRDDFVDYVEAVLRATRLKPQCLEIEITETLVMENADLFVGSLERLKAIGISISIDDFGTGYSSLNYLKRLPIDTLKIDQSFVRDIVDDPDDAAICRSIVEIAHSLRLKAVAEGVETEAQVNFLTRYNCDHLQGYLICRPSSAEEMTAKLIANNGSFLAQLGQGDISSENLLIVDDDEDTAAAIKLVVDHPSRQIFIARSAQDALQILASHSIAVVISDQRMPEMKGTEFLARVRYLYPNTVGILLSAYPEFTTASWAINDAGVFKFLTKPWDNSILRDCIRSAFELHRLLQQVEMTRGRLASEPPSGDSRTSENKSN